MQSDYHFPCVVAFHDKATTAMAGRVIIAATISAENTSFILPPAQLTQTLINRRRNQNPFQQAHQSE